MNRKASIASNSEHDLSTLIAIQKEQLEATKIQNAYLGKICRHFEKLDKSYIIERTRPKSTSSIKIISLEEKILSKDRWQKVLNGLLKNNFISFNKDLGEYRWQGIDGNNIASLATLATMLEKQKILDSFSSHADTSSAYFKFFSPKRPSQREWRNHFGDITEKFSTRLHFILSI